MAKKITGKVIGVWEKSISLNIGRDDCLVVWHSDFRRHNKTVPTIGDKVELSYDVLGRKPVKESKRSDGLSTSLYTSGTVVERVVDGFRSELVPEDGEVVEDTTDTDGWEE